MNLAVWVGVGALGGVGAIARYALDAAVQRRRAGEFPLGTLAVNVSGSFALGLLVGLGVVDDALLLSGTALLGSFTTFSTWVYESHRLAEEGEGRLALANLAVSLAAGIAAVAAGWSLGSVL